MASPSITPAVSAMLPSKLSSMQILLLTAMTLLGFYLCFNEIRRLTSEVASLRDQIGEQDKQKKLPEKEPAAPPTKPPAPAPVKNVVFQDEEDDDDAMDDGLRQMLEHLQRAAQAPPPAATVVFEEIPAEEASAPAEEAGSPGEVLMLKSKAEIEELLKTAGTPYKKSDSKGKLVQLALGNKDAAA